MKKYFGNKSIKKTGKGFRKSWGKEENLFPTASTSEDKLFKTKTQARKAEELAAATSKLHDPISLSCKQHEVLTTIMSRKSVFFTGAAGTGKSHILRILRDAADVLQLGDKIAFCAPTGVAACNIGGLTIHSWAGIGLGKDPPEQIVAQVSRSMTHKKRWLELEILVIDEISMLSAELFDLLSAIGCRVRSNRHVPFGGIQLVLCGDFYQLPPVHLSPKNRLCFRASSWNNLFKPVAQGGGGGSIIVLDAVFRQKDQAFLNILHEIRRGEVSYQTAQLMSRKVITDAQRKAQHVQQAGGGGQCTGILFKPTRLFGYNKDVESVNARELANNSSEAIRFDCVDEGEKKYLTQLKGGCRFPELLELKIGTEVMLLKNQSVARGLVNGARGVVVGFERSAGRSEIFPRIPVVEFSVRVGDGAGTETVSVVEEASDIRVGESVVASRQQLPLMLAYAITIHKSQGMTIPLLEVSFRGMFEYGQSYVALSRATCMDGLYLTSFDASCIKAHPEVKAYYSSLGYSEESEHKEDSTVTATIADFCDIYRAPPAASSTGLVAGSADSWISKKGSEEECSGSASCTSFSAAGKSVTEVSDGQSKLSNGTCDSGAMSTGAFSSYAYDDFMERRVPQPALCDTISGVSPAGRGHGIALNSGGDQSTRQQLQVGRGEGSGASLTGQKRDFMSAAALGDQLMEACGNASQGNTPPALRGGSIESVGRVGIHCREEWEDGTTDRDLTRNNAPPVTMYMRDYFPSRRSEPLQHHSHSLSAHHSSNGQLSSQWRSEQLTTSAHMKSSDPTVTVDLTVSEDSNTEFDYDVDVASRAVTQPLPRQRIQTTATSGSSRKQPYIAPYKTPPTTAAATSGCRHENGVNAPKTPSLYSEVNRQGRLAGVGDNTSRETGKCSKGSSDGNVLTAEQMKYVEEKRRAAMELLKQNKLKREIEMNRVLANPLDLI